MTRRGGVVPQPVDKNEGDEMADAVLLLIQAIASELRKPAPLPTRRTTPCSRRVR